MLRFSDFKIGKRNSLIHLILNSIFREQHLEDAFRKRNIEFKLLEDRLQQFEEKVKCRIYFIFILKEHF